MAIAQFCAITLTMTEQEDINDVMHILPIAVVLWLGYLLILGIIDLAFYLRPVFEVYFYLVNGLAALGALSVVIWHPAWPWLRKIFLPMVIGLISVVPILTAHFVITPGPPNLDGGVEIIVLRLMPLLLIGLVLMAWGYGWSKVVIYIAMIVLLTLWFQVSRFRPGGASLLPPLTILLIETVSFIIVGYFLSAMLRCLEQQRASLALANTQLAAFAATVEELTVSRERNRLARELHDTLAHTLSALTVQLETVRAYWEVDAEAAHAMLDKALASTRSGLVETRRALKSLRASPLEDMGLATALRQLAQETAGRANLVLTLILPDHLPPITPAIEQCIYRVAQEAIANVAYHANAHSLFVQLVAGNRTTLCIRDDGVGFDAQAIVPPGHFGLSGMRERTRLVGGTLTIQSWPGQGSEIMLEIGN